MATNEIYKDGDWIAVPLPLKGSDPAVNDDPTRNGDPVLIGNIVGVAQEVGGVPVVYTVGSTTVTQARNTANSLEPGYASIATKGAWAIPVTGAVYGTTAIGAKIQIKAAVGSTKAELVLSGGDHNFGILVGWTKDTTKRPIVKIVPSFS
jgi:hypothetical protein